MRLARCSVQTYIERSNPDGPHWSQNSKHSQSGQVHGHQLLLVAVRQTPTNMYIHTCNVINFFPQLE